MGESKGKSVLKILKRSFWLLYDHLGLWMALNLTWCLLSATIILLPAATLGLFHMARLGIQRDLDQMTYKHYWRYIWTEGWRQSFGFCLSIIIVILISYNLLFYSLLSFPWIGLKIIVTGLLFWLWVISLLWLAYVWALLESGFHLSLWEKLKYALFAVMGYPRLSLGVWSISLLLFVALYISIIGIFILSMSFLAIVWTNLSYWVFESSKHDFKKPVQGLDDRSARELWNPF